MAAFGKVQAENYEFPVFTCPELEEGSTVLTGYLERGASASIPLVFQPQTRRTPSNSGNVPWGKWGACATGEALGAGVREPVSSAEARLGPPLRQGASTLLRHRRLTLTWSVASRRFQKTHRSA